MKTGVMSIRHILRLRLRRVASGMAVLAVSLCALFPEKLSSFSLDRTGGDGILSDDLQRQLAKIRKSAPSAGAADPKSLAFLFLTDGNIVHDDLWRRWFESSSGDWTEKASIYVHIPNLLEKSLDDRPRTFLRELNPFFCQRIIPSVITRKFHRHHAMIQLLMHAFVNPHNSHFIFISGDGSIPLKSFDAVYEELIEENKSRTCLAPPKDAKKAWAPFARDERTNIQESDMYKAFLWSSYGRYHVAFLLANTEMLSDWYDAHVQSGDLTAGAAHELLLPTFLNSHVAPDELSDCHSRALLDEEGSSLDDPADAADNIESAWGCCPTYARWQTDFLAVDDPRAVLAPTFAKTPHSHGVYELFQEGALEELAGAPHFLVLHGVAANATVIMDGGTALHLALPLADALPSILDYQEMRIVFEEEDLITERGCIVNH